MAKNEIIINDKESALLKFTPEIPILRQLRAAQYLIDSHLIPDNITEPEQVITITQMGYELGLKPLVALSNISVIKGKPFIGASIIGAMLKREGYEYEFTKYWYNEGTPEDPFIVTEVTLYWKSEVLGREMKAAYKISWNEILKMGLGDKNSWTKIPKQMMAYRCLTFACRLLAPEVLLGQHTVDEIADAEDIPYVMTENGVVTMLNSEGDVISQEEELSSEDDDDLEDEEPEEKKENAAQKQSLMEPEDEDEDPDGDIDGEDA